MRKKRQTSVRTLKIAENIKNEVNEIISRGKIYDPQIGDISLTIYEVRISPDIRYADIYVTCFIETIDKNTLITYLNDSAKEIRYLLANSLNMRHTPILRFHHYDTLEKARKIEELLDSLE